MHTCQNYIYTIIHNYIDEDYTRIHECQEDYTHIHVCVDYMCEDYAHIHECQEDYTHIHMYVKTKYT